jgi:hypothetical protein
MPAAKRDEQQKVRAGLSEMEGRMLVLEVVAMTSLALVLDTSGRDDDSTMGRNVLHMIRDAVDSKCTEMGLSDEASTTAQSYAEELLGTAMTALFPSRH